MCYCVGCSREYQKYKRQEILLVWQFLDLLMMILLAVHSGRFSFFHCCLSLVGSSQSSDWLNSDLMITHLKLQYVRRKLWYQKCCEKCIWNRWKWNRFVGLCVSFFPNCPFLIKIIFYWMKMINFETKFTILIQIFERSLQFLIKIKLFLFCWKLHISDQNRPFSNENDQFCSKIYNFEIIERNLRFLIKIISLVLKIPVFGQNNSFPNGNNQFWYDFFWQKFKIFDKNEFSSFLLKITPFFYQNLSFQNSNCLNSKIYTFSE